MVTFEESRASGWTGLSRRDRIADEEPRGTEKKVMTFTGEGLILRSATTEKEGSDR